MTMALAGGLRDSKKGNNYTMLYNALRALYQVDVHIRLCLASDTARVGSAMQGSLSAALDLTRLECNIDGMNGWARPNIDIREQRPMRSEGLEEFVAFPAS